MSQKHRVRIEQRHGEGWALLDVMPADVDGTRVSIRYRAGITPDNSRIIVNSRPFGILSVENVGGKNRELVIQVAS